MSQSDNNELKKKSESCSRCFCRWAQCVEIQKVLQAKEPKGPYSGFVQIQNKIGKNANGVSARKMMFLRERLRKVLGIPKDRMQTERIYVAKHHWRPSVHEYAKSTKKSLQAFYKFESKAVWRKIAGTDDELDIFKSSGNSVSAILAPNYPQSEWKSTYVSKYDESAEGKGEWKGNKISTYVVNSSSRQKVEESRKRQLQEDPTEELFISKSKCARQEKQISALKQEIQKLKSENSGYQNRLLMMTNENNNQSIKIRDVSKAKEQFKAAKDTISRKLEQLTQDRFSALGVARTLVQANVLCRCTMFDDQYHQKNEKAASLLFRFKTWAETKIYVQELFPDVDTNQRSRIIGYDKEKSKFKFSQVTPFEQCLFVKMIFSVRLSKERLALFVGQGLSRYSIASYVKEWAPRWAKADQYLSILDVDPEYLQAERPIEYDREGYTDVAALMDGKDYLCESIRNDTAMHRNQHSNKMHASACREMNFTTPAGLSFLYSRLVGARLEENDLVKLMGAYGNDLIPLDDFKDIGKQSNLKASLNYRTAIDDYNERDLIVCNGDSDSEYSKNEASMEQLNSECFTLNSLILENSETQNAMRIMEEEDEDYSYSSDQDVTDESVGSEYDDSDEESEHPVEEFGVQECDDPLPKFNNGVNDKYSRCSMTMMMEKYDLAVKEYNQTKGGKIKSEQIILDNQLEEEAKRLIREQNPSCNPIEKLAQLEMHERLHCQYESGAISKCMLSFYLHVMTVKQRKLLHYMGSAMAEENWNDPSVELPKKGFPVGLAMIPKDWRILADKGFTFVSRDFPNFNIIDTPTRLGGRKNGRYDRGEILRDRKICKLRYTCETYFARVTAEEVLKDVISYSNLRIIPHVQAWAHAAANMQLPLRMPGQSNYFSNE